MTSPNETDSGNKINTYSIKTAVQSLNESLQSVGESPVIWKEQVKHSILEQMWLKLEVL